MDHKHQFADELLAGRCRRSLGNRAAALESDRRPAAKRRSYAEVHYRSEGWVLHHNTDIWRATAPVDGPWGIWPMGQAWLANQMWDHYLFTGDRDFLKQQAYPAMKEAAEFSLSSLVEIPAGLPYAGRLVTNSFHLPRERLSA